MAARSSAKGLRCIIRFKIDASFGLKVKSGVIYIMNASISVPGE